MPGLTVMTCVSPVRQREIGLVARDRQARRLVIGRHDDQRARMRVGIVHRRADGPIEVARFGQNALSVVGMRLRVDLRAFDHQQEAAFPSGVVRQNLESFFVASHR